MIGRVRELEMLRSAFESAQSEFVAIYGRRRVGKTYLVNEAFHHKFSFFHAGLKLGTMAQQLKNFRMSLVKAGHRSCPELKDWLEAFYELEMLLSRQPKGRKVVFIDEMPWLDTHKSDFLMALESFWNGWATSRKDILLVVCGSATSWIVNKILRNKGGLHNRIGTRIKLRPFTLAECEQYVRSRRLGYDRRMIAECYMAFGGVAYYWSLLAKGRSPEQNFNELFFGPNDGLRLEFDELYSSLFNNSEPYVKIVLLLGRKRAGLTRDELRSGIGNVDGGRLTVYLADLEECGFIRKYCPVGGKNGGVYQLIDNFSLFFMQFVLGNASRDGDYWTDRVSDGEKNAWRGFAFERLCLEHISQIKRALGISGVHTEVYSWNRSATRQQRGAQVDLLIDRRDGIVNLCEMKWSQGPFVLDKRECEKLLNRVAAFRTVLPKSRSIHLTLVTTCGLQHNGHWNNVQSEITLDQLFAE